MKRTQRDRLKDLFEYNKGRWIPLTQIWAMGICQYNSRLLDLRHEGMKIENKTKIENGIKKSWFRYNPQIKDDLFNEPILADK